MKLPLAQLLWHSPSAIPLAAGFALAAMIAIFWLYPPQAKVVKRPWRWIMPMLRMLALLALAVALLQPVAMRPRTVEQRGAVVVLLDRSKSMSVVDSGRSPADRVALAAALGALPSGVRDEPVSSQRKTLDRLRRLINEARAARSELDYAVLAGRSADVPARTLTGLIRRMRTVAEPLLAQAVTKALAEKIAALPDSPTDAQLADSSAAIQQADGDIKAAQAANDTRLYEANEAVRAAADAVNTLSRASLGVKSVTAPDGILARFAVGTPVYAFSFDSEVVPLPSLATAPSSLNLIAQGQSSDVTGALRAVLDRVGRGKLQAIILISDGRQVGGDASPAAVAMLGGSSTPIFVIDPTGPLPSDVSVAGMSMPSSIYIGETLTARVEIAGRNIPDAPVTVQAHVPGGAEPQVQSTTLINGSATVEFALKMTESGIQPVRISVTPMAGEVSAENNTIERRVKVIAGKLKVVAVSPAPSWDFQYARNALSRAPGIELTDVTTGTPSDDPAFSPGAIASQDVALISDVRVESLSAPQWSALKSLATRRGGSVIILVNDLSVIRQYENNPQLSVFLPYRSELQSSWQIWPGREPEFALEEPQSGDQFASASLDPGGDSTGGNWQQLPGFFRYLAMPELKAGVRTLLIERKRAAPMLTEARVGAGRVFFFGANETWRWRRGVGERFQDRFWLQLARMAGDEPYAVHQGELWLDITPVTPVPGAALTLRARVENEGAAEAPDELHVRISDDADEIVADTHMTAVGSAGRFETTVQHAPAAGNYEVTVSNPRDASQTITAPLVVEAPDARAEMIDLSGNPTLLRRIAEATDGHYVPIDRIATVAEQLDQLRERQSSLAEYTLWDSPYLFAFVLACLGAEWGLRKRFGLA